MQDIPNNSQLSVNSEPLTPDFQREDDMLIVRVPGLEQALVFGTLKELRTRVNTVLRRQKSLLNFEELLEAYQDILTGAQSTTEKEDDKEKTNRINKTWKSGSTKRLAEDLGMGLPLSPAVIRKHLNENPEAGNKKISSEVQDVITAVTKVITAAIRPETRIDAKLKASEVAEKKEKKADHVDVETRWDHERTEWKEVMRSANTLERENSKLYKAITLLLLEKKELLQIQQQVIEMLIQEAEPNLVERMDQHVIVSMQTKERSDRNGTLLIGEDEGLAQARKKLMKGFEKKKQLTEVHMELTRSVKHLQEALENLAAMVLNFWKDVELPEDRRPRALEISKRTKILGPLIKQVPVASAEYHYLQSQR